MCAEQHEFHEKESAKLTGWHELVKGYPWFEGQERYPLPAYSEFTPPPRLGRSPYGFLDDTLFHEDDPYGWYVSEMDEEYQLRPGLEHISRQVMSHLLHLGQGKSDYHIAGHGGQNLLDNPYWPPELADRAGQLRHERFVSFLPFALSKTQDDKARVIWTLFGGSEQGLEVTFWKSFYRAPGQEQKADDGMGFFIRLLSTIYNENLSTPEQLHAAGFRILVGNTHSHHEKPETLLPAWTRAFVMEEHAPVQGVRYLLTFAPFSQLPVEVRQAYLSGLLHLIPFPGSLVYLGMKTYQHLQQQLPLAMQIPLLRLVARHAGLEGLRVPQTGWLHQPHPGMESDAVQKELLQETYARTHRWDRVHRYEDELALTPRVAKVNKVLFGTDLETLDLYDKPMARNCQIWDRNFDLLLDGPHATPRQIHKAEAALTEGGLFAYRFQFPAMQVGVHEVYWHRPVVAYLSQHDEQVMIFPDAPLGYLTAYTPDYSNLAHPVELWPRLLRRPVYLAALTGFHSPHDHYAHQTSLNIISLLEVWRQSGQQSLSRDFARQIVRVAKDESLDDWLASLKERSIDPHAYQLVQASLQEIIASAGDAEKAIVPGSIPDPITYHETRKRDFEVSYWNDIKTLSDGSYLTKDNADVVLDPTTEGEVTHHHRDLDYLGDYLIRRHRDAIAKAGMEGRARCGELPFHWRTDFDFPLFGGWKSNQEGHAYERDILVYIPGNDHSQCVILADHYDTAYMEDIYYASRGGNGARKAAAGADDNDSATATLLQAAPIYLHLAREGKLQRDIWLLHLTGEEFPADSLGARHFCQAVVEKTLRLHLEADQWIDLSNTRVAGLYVMDMIAHNRDSDRNIFQISPGMGLQSLQLARQAHIANMIWNNATREWNMSPERVGCGHGKRSQDGSTIPDISKYLSLGGEVRTVNDPASSLFNTDGQIFSDTGIPAVLFMENYDINRTGYHDSLDTMANIDLDYGAALAAIAIETVARVACLVDIQSG